MTDFRSIYITTDDPIPFPFQGVIFHCIYVPYLLYSFLYQCTFSLLPCPGYLHPIWASHTIYPGPGPGTGNSSLQDMGYYASLLLSTLKLVETPSLYVCMLVLFPLSLSRSPSLLWLSCSSCTPFPGPPFLVHPHSPTPGLSFLHIPHFSQPLLCPDRPARV